MPKKSLLRRTLLRALPSGALLLSAGLKLFELDLFELYLFSLGLFSFDLCSVIARVVVGLELGLGVALLVGWRERRISQLSLLLLLLFSLWLLWRMALGDQTNCHCMGALVEMHPTQSLIKNLLLALPLLYLSRHPQPSAVKLREGWIISLLIALLLTPTLLSPPDYWYRLQGGAKELHEERFEELLLEVGWEKKRGVILLLSTECPYCQKTMRKLSSLIGRHHLSEEGLYALFLPTSDEMEERIEEALLETKCAVEEWATPSARLLLRASGGALPLIILYDGDRVIAEYNYRTFDEGAISRFLHTL